MAPDISDKKTKQCKKYIHSDHNKYKQWEKERRDRFNVKLECLASYLPNYDKENPWKKVEIVENAILTLKNRANNLNKSDPGAQKSLSEEIANLKRIILQFTQFKKSNEDIFEVDSNFILTTLNNLILQDNADDSHHDQSSADLQSNDESLAFIAKIAQSNDHCYSVSVTEPELRVDSEEVVESNDMLMPNLPNSSENVVTILPVPSVANDTFITLVPETPMPLPQLISIDEMSTLTNVRTIFVNKGSKSSVDYQPTVPQLTEVLGRDDRRFFGGILLQIG